jgi:Fe-S cluster biosynthesis and repair protein YggX
MAMVHCVKLKKEAEGLDRPPFPNELGKRIHENVSKDGWKLWLAHSTMLINENRIDLSSKQGTKYLLDQCEAFFFGEGGDVAAGYVPPPSAAATPERATENAAPENEPKKE